MYPYINLASSMYLTDVSMIDSKFLLSQHASVEKFCPNLIPNFINGLLYYSVGSAGETMAIMSRSTKALRAQLDKEGNVRSLLNVF